MSNNPWPTARERRIEAEADAIIERETAERAKLKAAAKAFRAALLGLDLRHGTGAEWTRDDIIGALDDLLAAPDEPSDDAVYLEAERRYWDRAADVADYRAQLARENVR